MGIKQAYLRRSLVLCAVLLLFLHGCDSNKGKEIGKDNVSGTDKNELTEDQRSPKSLKPAKLLDKPVQLPDFPEIKICSLTGQGPDKGFGTMSCEINGKTYFAHQGEIVKDRYHLPVPGYPNLKVKGENKDGYIIFENNGKIKEVKGRVK